MTTTETPTTEQPEGNYCGILQVDTKVMQHLMPEISIDNIDTQGHLRDSGVFTSLHDRFLLPNSYKVRNVFYEHLRDIWNVFIISPDFPDANEFSWENIEYPRIEPVYCLVDNVPHLVEIIVHAQRTVPVTGGVQWLLKAL